MDFRCRCNTKRSLGSLDATAATLEAHIGDFVAMADGSYPSMKRMKRIAVADALAHKKWVSFAEDF